MRNQLINNQNKYPSEGENTKTNKRLPKKKPAGQQKKRDLRQLNYSKIMNLFEEDLYEDGLWDKAMGLRPYSPKRKHLMPEQDEENINN